MALFCPEGHSNSDDSAFCGRCGRELERAPAESFPPPGRLQDVEPVAAVSSPVPISGANTENAQGQNRVAALVGVSVLGVLLIGGLIFAFVSADDPGANSAADGDVIRGIAVLLDDSGGVVEGDWDDCEGTGGFSDFSEGTRLSVTGADGEIVGTGDVVNVTEANIDDVVRADWEGDDPIGLTERTDLEAAKSELQETLEAGAELELGCMLYFEAAIDQSSYYAVELSDRGDLSYSREELEADNFVVSISLGQ